MEIPKILVDQIREGQALLFLGAGASRGASHRSNQQLPVGKELGAMIAKKFLGEEFVDRPLDQIAELAISETDLYTVQKFIADIFYEFYPADFHELIPKFMWVAIATTNYDLIIERAYDAVKDKLQQPVVFKKNGERIEQRLKAPNSLIYLKLHGCITDTNDSNIPLILTPEQYITHKKGRSRLFERLENLAYEFPLLFIGHTLSDPDLRAILLDLAELRDAKPRSYLVSPNVTSADKRLWENRKIHVIEKSFQAFLLELDNSIPEHARILSTLIPREEHPLFRRCQVSNKIRPSESLTSFLTKDVDYVHKGIKTTVIDPKAFYKGYFIDLSPIINELDVRRLISDDIMSEVLLTGEEDRTERQEFYLLKGHAGSGKSVILNRIAWDASVEYDRLCLFVKPFASPDYEPLAELYNLCKDRIFLFVDPVDEYLDLIEEFIHRSRKDKLPLTIIGAERHNEWNISCENLEPYLTHTYELEYLTEKEIRDLIGLLSRHKSLGYLEELKPQERQKALSKKAGRQLLAALHEATLGKAFTDIVFDEYQSIASRKAQSLYLTVCILHRLGIHTRAGVISRVHAIPFAMFQDELFKPLEFVVFALKNELIMDYVYRSRHAHIAEIVFERVLVQPEDRYDEYMRIIAALDVDYNADREAFKKLVSARQLLDLFKDPQMIGQVYEVAKKRFPENPWLMQQEAIFEMNCPGGSMDRATSLLQQAHKLAPYNKAIAHSLAELSSKKADKASKPLEKKKFRQESRKIALEIISGDALTSPAYHTLIKVGIDELSELLDQADQATVERKIKDVEKTIAKALQFFPDDPYILASESKFSELIDRHPQAFESMRRAFKRNKRNAYIAARLAKMYEERNEMEQAIGVLENCVEASPSNKYINFRLGMLMTKLPGSNKAEIKHHLRRSFTEGDSNYVAQFWYARFVYLENDYDEAYKIFDRLRDANLDTRVKKEPRGVVVEDGRPVRFYGTVSKLESSYGFIIRDGYQDKIFAHCLYTSNLEWESLKSQKRVTFELGFNYRGPFAVNIESEEKRF